MKTDRHAGDVDWLGRSALSWRGTSKRGASRMAETPDRRIGGAIARLREERGWSQRALAKVVGLDQSALSRVEAGKRRLAAGELDVIARALGSSPCLLYTSPSPRDRT